MIEESSATTIEQHSFEARIVIVTGMSGAGKTLALRVLEDIGFTAIDNISPELLPVVVDHASRTGVERLALVTDARSGDEYSELLQVLDGLRKTHSSVSLLFLDASDEALVQRFKETRRPHPLCSPDEGVFAGIAAERMLLADARDAADRVIDTSALIVPELRSLMEATFSESPLGERLVTTIVSFGFKYGLPLEADLVFDVRFLRNPYWVSELRVLDGMATEVREYISHDPNTGPLLGKLYDLIDFSLPQYQRDGKAYLTIAIGCTGGQHRSVAVAEMLAEMIRDKGRHVHVKHRDVAAAKLRDSSP